MARSAHDYAVTSTTAKKPKKCKKGKAGKKCRKRQRGVTQEAFSR